MPAPPPNPPPMDCVRPYDPQTDVQVVKMLIGQGVMEGLALANQRFIWHPITISVWLALSLLLNHTMGWYPSPSLRLTYIRPIFGFASCLIPILVLAEYLHRPTWTRLLRETVGSPDVVALQSFYSLDPCSRLLVFEHEGGVHGCVALDGKRPGQDLGTVLGAEEREMGMDGVMEKAGLGGKGGKQDRENGRPAGGRDGLRTRAQRKGGEPNAPAPAPGLVQIRHLDVDQPVRRRKVGTELLAAALDHAFAVESPDSIPVATPAERVVVLTNPFSPGGEKLFRRCGFLPVPTSHSGGWQQPQAVGVLQWKGRWIGVSRADWLARRDEIFRRDR